MLLDLLVTLLLCSVAVLLTLGGIALAARGARVMRERALQGLEARNELARGREVLLVRTASPQ